MDTLNAAYRQLVDSEEDASLSISNNLATQLSNESTPVKSSPRNSAALAYHQCRHKLAEAAEALQEAIADKEAAWPSSSPDYKRIAINTTRALDAVTRMLQSDVQLLRSVHLIPAAEVEVRSNVLKTLLAEARERFGLPTSATVLDAESATSQRQLPVVPRLFGSKPPVLHAAIDSDVERSINHDGGDSTRQAFTPKEAPAQDRAGPPIDPSEVYDARLMFPGNEWRSAEGEDQCEQLRQLVAKLTSENAALSEHVEQLVAQLDSTRETLSAEVAAAIKAQEQVESDMRTLAQALDAETKAVDVPAKEMTSEGVQVDLQPTPVESPQRPATTGTPRGGHHLDTSALSTIRAYSPIRAAAEPSDTPSNRYQRLERLYTDVYSGRGMEMIWSAVDTVFRCEYDGKEAVGSSMEQSELYNRFQSDFDREVASVVGNQQAFSEMVQGVTPLRSDYVAHCLSHRVKANSGVVTLLSRFKSDRLIRELSLEGNYIGDHGVLPLLPLLARMHNLVELNLANNGIRNDGARNLCKALSSHPSLRRINLSHNAIARAGGKDILSLVNTCPRIVAVELDGTAMDAALKSRIAERTEANGAL